MFVFLPLFLSLRVVGCRRWAIWTHREFDDNNILVKYFNCCFKNYWAAAGLEVLSFALFFTVVVELFLQLPRVLVLFIQSALHQWHQAYAIDFTQQLQKTTKRTRIAHVCLFNCSSTLCRIKYFVVYSRMWTPRMWLFSCFFSPRVLNGFNWNLINAFWSESAGCGRIRFHLESGDKK